MSDRQLISSVRQSLTKIARSSGAKFEELEEKFWKNYEDKSLADSSFSEALRQSAAMMAINQQYVVDYETEKLSYFFLGYSNIRGTNPSRESFILAADKTMHRLMFRGDSFVKLPTTIKAGAYFEKGTLGKFRSGSDYFATTATPLEPTKQYDIAEILSKMNIPQVTCVSSLRNPSKLQEGSTYTDSSDWRMIEGFVNRISTGVRDKDKVPFGVIDITDSTSLESMEILEDGSTKQAKITGFIDVNLLDFDMGSYCKFYGPIAVDDKSKVTMTIMQRVTMLLKERKK